MSELEISIIRVVAAESDVGIIIWNDFRMRTAILTVFVFVHAKESSGNAPCGECFAFIPVQVKCASNFRFVLWPFSAVRKELELNLRLSGCTSTVFRQSWNEVRLLSEIDLNSKFYIDFDSRCCRAWTFAFGPNAKSASHHCMFTKITISRFRWIKISSQIRFEIICSASFSYRECESDVGFLV